MCGRKNSIKWYRYNGRIYYSPIKVFNLNNNSKVALIGGGGKTTTIKDIALDYTRRGIGNIIMTTTNILYENVEYDVQKIKYSLNEGLSVVVGEVILKEGIKKISKPRDEIYNFLINQNNYPVIVEADGAKCRPIKIQREYEPEIPDNIKDVILVVGIDSLHGPIKEVFARPEDVKLNKEFLEIDDFVDILLSNRGMFKDLEEKNVTILINKVDSIELLKESDLIINKIKKRRKELKVVISGYVNFMEVV